MDIQLPTLDGYEATRQIKSLAGFAAVPIIAMSSFAMKGDEEKARAAAKLSSGKFKWFDGIALIPGLIILMTLVLLATVYDSLRWSM